MPDRFWLFHRRMPRFTLAIRRADVYSLINSSELIDGGIVDDSPTLHPAQRQLFHDEVVADREFQRQTRVMAIRGNRRSPEAVKVERRHDGEPVTAVSESAARRSAQPGQHLGELLLAVTVDAGDTQDLSRPNLQ